MPETDVDRRGRRLLLASHGVLAGPDAAGAARALIGWAQRHGVGVYQLPLPAHALRPRTASGRLAPPRAAELRREASELGAVVAELADYVSAGYEVLGLALGPADGRTAPGRRWLARVLDAARAAGLDLPLRRLTGGPGDAAALDGLDR